MNGYLIFLTIISSIALVLSCISVVIWWKDADYWIEIRANIKYLMDGYEMLAQNNRRCIICKDRKDRMCS